MLTNKWILLALSILAAGLSAAAGFNWNSLVSPQSAGAISSAIGLTLAVLHALAPPTSQPQITATGASVFTHT